MKGMSSSSREASLRMSKVRQKGTSAELKLRKAMHAKGLRYSLHVTLLPRRVADIVFPNLRIAIFVDGCFWHGCPEHGSWPKNNGEFWRRKIEANKARDEDTTRRLIDLGWQVIRVWEHEVPTEAAKYIFSAVSKRRDMLSELKKRQPAQES